MIPQIQPLFGRTLNNFDSIFGRVSLRVGATVVSGQYIFQPYFTASVVHEFASPITSTLDRCVTGFQPNTPSSIFEFSIFSTGRIGTYGQFGLGLVGARYTFDPEKGPRRARTGPPTGVPWRRPPHNWTGVFFAISAPVALWGEGKWNFGGLAGNAANNYTGVLAGGGGFNYRMGALVLGG
jgi:hypothetical protein